MKFLFRIWLRRMRMRDSIGTSWKPPNTMSGAYFLVLLVTQGWFTMPASLLWKPPFSLWNFHKIAPAWWCLSRESLIGPPIHFPGSNGTHLFCDIQSEQAARTVEAAGTFPGTGLYWIWRNSNCKFIILLCQSSASIRFLYNCIVLSFIFWF